MAHFKNCLTASTIVTKKDSNTVPILMQPTSSCLHHDVNLLNRTRKTIHRVMFGWLARIRSQHSVPHTAAALSIFLYFTGCPHSVWNLLCRLRLVMSITWTQNLMKIA